MRFLLSLIFVTLPYICLALDIGNDVEIESKTLKVFFDENRAEFLDDIVMKSGDLRIYADKLIVVFKEETIDVAKFSNNVKIKFADQIAKGDMAEYIMSKSSVILSGDVRLLQNSNEIIADKLIYNIKTKQVQLVGKHTDANKKRRVKAKFNSNLKK
ncbi:MAG: lipopolysaccharide export system protein LptA [Candidatus Midichloriaceae bacterium]|jgi:lipopolysaccharide export system protein LptA